MVEIEIKGIENKQSKSLDVIMLKEEKFPSVESDSENSAFAYGQIVSFTDGSDHQLLDVKDVDEVNVEDDPSEEINVIITQNYQENKISLNLMTEKQISQPEEDNADFLQEVEPNQEDLESLNKDIY